MQYNIKRYKFKLYQMIHECTYNVFFCRFEHLIQSNIKLHVIKYDIVSYLLIFNIPFDFESRYDTSFMV